MKDAAPLQRSFSRPRLLMQAARSGVSNYRRERDLGRIVGLTGQQPADRTLDRLISIEAGLEATRRAGGAAYSITRHVEVLIALLAEARAQLARP